MYSIMMDEHRIARWVQQQGKIWAANNSDDDGLRSSPDLHSHPAHASLSPSPPPLSPIGATSPPPPSPPQQHSRTPSPRSRKPLQRIHTVGSIILPPTSPLRSKITNHHTLLSVRPEKYRSGSLSPVLPFLSPSDTLLQKTGRNLSSSDRCQSLQKIPSDEDPSFPDHHETDDDLPDCDLSEEHVNYSDLELLASQIGSKLSLVTDLLGLPSSDYEYALEDIKSPKFQALYVLKKWLDAGDRRIGELCAVLEKANLSHIAKWYRHGILEEQLKRDQDRLKMKRHELIKRNFPSLNLPKSFDSGRVAEADRSKQLGALSETKLIKHNTLCSFPPVAATAGPAPAREYHFLAEEK